VPNSKPECSSTPEVQRTTVHHNLFGQQRLLILLAPAINDSVINITLTAADPAALQQPNLGLNVTVNGSSLPALVAVADGQLGANTLASTLRQALRLGRSLAVGVEWSAAEDGRSVTYQVAAAGSTNITLVSCQLAQRACLSTAMCNCDELVLVNAIIRCRLVIQALCQNVRLHLWQSLGCRLAESAVCACTMAVQ
jgi:hypothetical protein